jgi:hypothetical protein
LNANFTLLVADTFSATAAIHGRSQN